MADPLPNSPPRPALALRAIIDRELRVFPVRVGMTIGSDPRCDIQVPRAYRRNATVTEREEGLGLEGVSEIAGEYPRWFPLNSGSEFVIGETIIDCVELSEIEEEQEDADTTTQPIRGACPRCRTNLTAIDLGAKFCPHCGAPLPADCPQWPPVDTEPPVAQPARRWWARWMPSWLNRRIDPIFFGRGTAVLAYINTLFNLGLRYESGVDRARNLPQALRYYRKAARLGSLPARVRIKVKDEPSS